MAAVTIQQTVKNNNISGCAVANRAYAVKYCIFGINNVQKGFFIQTMRVANVKIKILKSRDKG